MVMRPLAWPVITWGPPGGARRKSNMSPRSGSSWIFERTGRPSWMSCETSLRFAPSIFDQ